MIKTFLKSLFRSVTEAAGLALMCSAIGAFLFLPVTPRFDKPYVAHALEIIPMLALFSLPLSMMYSVPYVALSRIADWGLGESLSLARVLSIAVLSSLGPASIALILFAYAQLAERDRVSAIGCLALLLISCLCCTLPTYVYYAIRQKKLFLIGVVCIGLLVWSMWGLMGVQVIAKSLGLSPPDPWGSR